jgi:hypothetical protein
MQQNPQCYIDADGRVACDAGPTPNAGGRQPSQRTLNPGPGVPQCCVDGQGIIHCVDPTHPINNVHASYASQFGVHPSRIPPCPPAQQAPTGAPQQGAPQPPASNPRTNPMYQRNVSTIPAPSAATIAAVAGGGGAPGSFVATGQLAPDPGRCCVDSVTGMVTCPNGKADWQAHGTVIPPNLRNCRIKDGREVCTIYVGDAHFDVPMCKPKTPAPDCCVHIKTNTLTSITPQNPKPGRIDCPETSEWHERDVTVVGVQSDGKGGMLARVVFQKMPGQGAQIPGDTIVARQTNALISPSMIPVCTGGPQDKPPIPCCLGYGPDGRSLVVICDDPSHPMHRRPADSAISMGYTLEMCPPPPKVPPCCVELGNFSGKNGRLICEDEAHPAHGAAIDVDVSPDGTSAVFKGTIKGTDYVLEIPTCVITDEPEEVPCCVRRGVLECPGTQYHGMPYSVFQKQHSAARLLPCPETPPPAPPPDCCVKREGNRAFLVCSGGPWNGYQLKPTEFQCHDTPQGERCSIALQIPGQSNIHTAILPVCPEPPPEKVPPDCCFDVATGRLVCSDTSSEFHNLQVSLVDLQGGLPHNNGYALVSHPRLGSTPARFPVCDVPVPPECCFEPTNNVASGSKGKLVCPGTELHGALGTITALTPMPDGSMLATVAYLGGASRMKLCAPPPEECPPHEPPYFCCVNLDTGLFVCPANDARHGKRADVKEVIDIGGSPWAVLANGQRMPGCGIKCPAPEPCCPPIEIPEGTPLDTPPGPPVPPCPPGEPPLPQPNGGTNTPPGPPVEVDCPPEAPIPASTPPDTLPGPPPQVDCPPHAPVPQDSSTNTQGGPPEERPCPPQTPLPPPNGGTDTLPGPQPQVPCPPQTPLPPPNGGTDTQMGPPPQGPCPPQTPLPPPNGGTDTQPGPPAPGCPPNGAGVPLPPPFR